MTDKSWNKNMDNISQKQRLVLKPYNDFYFDLFFFSTGTEFPVTTDRRKRSMDVKNRGKEKRERKGKKKGKGKTKGERKQKVCSSLASW